MIVINSYHCNKNYNHNDNKVIVYILLHTFDLN